MSARWTDDRCVVETITVPGYALLWAYLVAAVAVLTWTLL